MANKTKTAKKSIIFITMLVLLAGAMTLCSKPGYPDEPENDRNRFVLEDGAFDTEPYNQPNVGQ